MSNRSNENQEWVVNEKTIKEFKNEQSHQIEYEYADGSTSTTRSKRSTGGKYSKIARVITTVLIIALVVVSLLAVFDNPNYEGYYPEDQTIVINDYSLEEKSYMQENGEIVLRYYFLEINFADPQHLKIEDFRFIVYLQYVSSNEIEPKNTSLHSIDGEELHYTITGNFSSEEEIEKITQIKILLSDGTVLEPQVKERIKSNHAIPGTAIAVIIPIIVAVNVIAVILEAIEYSKKRAQLAKEAVTDTVNNQKPVYNSNKHIHSKLPVCPYCDQQNPKDAHKCISCGANLIK